MKKVHLILIFALIFVLSCTNQEKQDEKKLQALKAVAERTATAPGNNPWDIGDKDVAPTHGKLSFEVIKEYDDDGGCNKDVAVCIDINSGYANIGAISMVIAFDKKTCDMYKFDKTTLHNDLQAALLAAPGAFMTNTVDGKFYFAWYCLQPVTMTTSNGKYKICTLSFKLISQPAHVMFDTIPGNCEYSLDGVNHLILSLEDIDL